MIEGTVIDAMKMCTVEAEGGHVRPTVLFAMNLLVGNKLAMESSQSLCKGPRWEQSCFPR